MKQLRVHRFTCLTSLFLCFFSQVFEELLKRSKFGSFVTFYAPLKTKITDTALCGSPLLHHTATTWNANTFPSYSLLSLGSETNVPICALQVACIALLTAAPRLAMGSNDRG